MRKTACLALAALFIFLTGSAQDQDQYFATIKQAEQRYQSKQYASSASKYKEAFDVFGGKAIPKDRYNAACAYALAHRPDSAFYHLFKLANDSRYDNYRHLSTDTDLVSLYHDKRWKELTTLVKANREKAEANLDRALAARLDTVYDNDQKYRMAMDSVEKKYGWESKEMQALFQQMHEADSVNLVKVSEILDSRGWLGKDIAGKQGNETLFLVIQHASALDAQLKYLPMMKQAAKDGKLDPTSFALLEDRIELRQGRPQIYGSQIGRDDRTGEYYVQALIDPDNVDKRREQVGLGRLQDYVSMWNIKWDVEAYKKKLPELIKNQRKW